jgi:hypothetical protein
VARLTAGWLWGPGVVCLHYTVDTQQQPAAPPAAAATHRELLGLQGPSLEQAAAAITTLPYDTGGVENATKQCSAMPSYVPKLREQATYMFAWPSLQKVGRYVRDVSYPVGHTHSAVIGVGLGGDRARDAGQAQIGASATFEMKEPEGHGMRHSLAPAGQRQGGEHAGLAGLEGAEPCSVSRVLGVVDGEVGA